MGSFNLWRSEVDAVERQRQIEQLELERKLEREARLHEVPCRAAADSGAELAGVVEYFSDCPMWSPIL